MFVKPPDFLALINILNHPAGQGASSYAIQSSGFITFYLSRVGAKRRSRLAGRSFDLTQESLPFGVAQGFQEPPEASEQVQQGMIAYRFMGEGI
jgi:hypothetical protein